MTVSCIVNTLTFDVVFGTKKCYLYTSDYGSFLLARTNFYWPLASGPVLNLPLLLLVDICTCCLRPQIGVYAEKHLAADHGWPLERVETYLQECRKIKEDIEREKHRCSVCDKTFRNGSTLRKHGRWPQTQTKENPPPPRLYADKAYLLQRRSTSSVCNAKVVGFLGYVLRYILRRNC